MPDELLDTLDGKHNEFHVWYKTKTGQSKRKGFETINEIEIWCKKQKGKITITYGSW